MKLSNMMSKVMNTTPSFGTSIGLLIMRVGISFSMIYLHGYPKLVNFSEFSTDFVDPFGVGITASLALVIFAEFF